MRHTRYGWWLEQAGPVESSRRSTATRPPTSSSSAAATSGSGRPGSSKGWSPEVDVLVLEAGLSATARAAGTAGSSRRCGTTCRPCGSGSATRRRSTFAPPSEASRDPGVVRRRKESTPGTAAQTLIVATWEAQLESTGRSSRTARPRCAGGGRPIAGDELRARCAAGPPRRRPCCSRPRTCIRRASCSGFGRRRSSVRSPALRADAGPRLGRDATVAQTAGERPRGHGVLAVNARPRRSAAFVWRSRLR